MITFDDAVALVRRSSTFEELTGAGTTYRSLAKLIHPDAVRAAQRATATEAFAKLARLHAARAALSGDIADLTVVDGALRKVPRDPRDNDLMEAEATALRALRSDGDPKYRAYAPRLVDSFVHEDTDRRRRRVNVIERLTGFVPLSEVRRELDPRDAAWMWRRLLVGLGWAHRAGVVHGAVFEEHVLIHPAEHGVALVDWCYSSPSVSAVIKDRDYPPEVRATRSIGPATDVWLATALMKRLIGRQMPAAMRRFADGCMFDAPRMRPQDPWRLLGEFDELLHSLYGPRTFRPFTL